jgi:hypothetical protein
VILFTFVNFDEVPALATSVMIGIGIIFCGIASVQNVYLWQVYMKQRTLQISRKLNYLFSGKKQKPVNNFLKVVSAN